MSLHYVESRIKEALRLAGGNIARARQQVMAWTYEDTKLLHELAKPHLGGIVAYNVERVASGRSEKAREASPKPKKHEKINAKEFGLEILQAIVTDGGPMFGLESGAPMPRRASVSQAHVDAIRQMAAAKKTDPKNPKK